MVWRREIMSTEHVVVLITVPSHEEGEEIATMLVESNLAACVNILPEVHSIYSWRGNIHTDQEVILLAKSPVELFEEKLLPAVLDLHSYEVPEVIAVPIIQGLDRYLAWVTEETNG
jgi:periplasmic divalent cation tolerance protein